MSRPQVQDPGRAGTPTPLSGILLSVGTFVRALMHARALPFLVRSGCGLPSKPGQLGAKPGTPCASLIDDGPTQSPFLTLRQEWSISSRKRPRLFTPLALPSYPCSAGAQAWACSRRRARTVAASTGECPGWRCAGHAESGHYGGAA